MVSKGKFKHLRKLYNHRLFGTVTKKNQSWFQEFFPELSPVVGDRLLIRDMPMPDELLKALR